MSDYCYPCSFVICMIKRKKNSSRFLSNILQQLYSCAQYIGIVSIQMLPIHTKCKRDKDRVIVFPCQAASMLPQKFPHMCVRYKSSNIR